MEDLADACPVRFFNLIPDPRAANVRHRLIDILVMAFAGVLCGADGWKDIADFVKAKADWFASFLDLRHGTPSADTFRRVISRLDPDAFERCFTQWMAAVAGQCQGLVAIDGKSLRRSFERSWDKGGMAHMVSAFASHNGQVLAQLKSDGKGGELEAIRQLLGLIDLRGATVTIDAIGCQKDIARQIVEGGGHYILAVKENQKTLHHRVQVEMDDMIRNQFKGVWHDRYEGEPDAGHGRIETRRAWVTDELGWLKQADQWAGLKSVLAVEADREVIGQDRSVERRYYISSLDADAQVQGQGARGHWGVENGLHHVLDVSFHEDDCRVRRGHGPQNLSRLRRMALNRLKAADHLTKRKSIKGRRKIAGWDNQFLLNLFIG